MNIKTTLGLAVVLACLALGYLLWRPAAEPTDAGTASETPQTKVARKLLEAPPEDVTKVTYRTERGVSWVFVKQEGEDGGAATWRMTEPLDIPVAGYEMDRIIRRLRDLEYEISYTKQITGAEAGLEPAEALVTLAGEDGEPIAIQIGREAATGGTYVRLSGSEQICVSTSSIGDLFKSDPLDYHDLQVCKFKPEDVTRIEAVDRTTPSEPITYVVARHGDRWMFEAPITARATSKLDEVARTLSRLRATEWLQAESDRLGAYGLDPARLTVRVTVAEEVEPDTDDAEAAAEEEQEDEEGASETKTEETVHVLHFSGRSPIGEDTKVYMRVDDGPAVATVMKSTVDKLTPDEKTWREMRITTANVSDATKIELYTPDGAATLVKADGVWAYESDASPAEDASVVDLLNAIGKLKAVAFVQLSDDDLSPFGLDPPRADINLTIPGVEGGERIVVGGFTDSQTKRLVYVRRNQLQSVAKVRAADVLLLTRGPRAYRDKTIFNVSPDQFEQVTITRHNKFTEGDDTLTFEREGDSWKMVKPVSVDVREDRLNKLISTLGGLRAQAVAATAGEASAFGLNAPEATVTFTYKPPVEYRFEKKEGEELEGEEAEGAGDDGTVPVEVQPPSETRELAVTRHDGKLYGKRADRPAVYVVGAPLYDQLHAELRRGDVLSFDADSVRRFSIRRDEKTHAFAREGDGWLYEREPDLPLDTKKVENLLLQVQDLDTERFAVQTEVDPADYGLAEPFHEVVVTLQDGTDLSLVVAGQVNEVDPAAGFYAMASGQPGLFLLTPDAVNRFSVSLDNLEAAP